MPELFSDNPSIFTESHRHPFLDEHGNNDFEFYENNSFIDKNDIYTFLNLMIVKNLSSTSWRDDFIDFPFNTDNLVNHFMTITTVDKLNNLKKLVAFYTGITAMTPCDMIFDLIIVLGCKHNDVVENEQKKIIAILDKLENGTPNNRRRFYRYYRDCLFAIAEIASKMFIETRLKAYDTIDYSASDTIDYLWKYNRRK
jgi:hypothetical protein